MKVKQIFEADDGTQFNSEEACENYENYEDKINRIMNQLNCIPDECSFYNGDGYVKQNKAMVNKAIKQLMNFIIPIIGKDDKWNEVIHDPFKYRLGIVGRYLDDSCIKILYKAWIRFMNMDDDYREWGQYYYALNPTEGKQKEWSKENVRMS